MRFPQGYIFLDKKTHLPPLSTVQAWFTSKTEIYVQGFSPKSKAVEERIRLIKELHCYINPKVSASMRCIAFSDTKVSQTFILAKGTDIKKIYWIDSAEQAKEIRRIASAVEYANLLNDHIYEIRDLYDSLAEFIYQKEGHRLVGDIQIQQFFAGRDWGTKSEAEIHIRQIAKNETRAGVLVRLDLDAELEESDHAKV